LSNKELEDQEKTILKELLINKDKYKVNFDDILTFTIDMLSAALNTVT
jgi:hypothetical protein